MKKQQAMTVTARAILARDVFIRHGLLLVLSSCFHIIMLFPQRQNADLFFMEEILLLPFEYWICAALVLGCGGFVLQGLLRIRHNKSGKDSIGISETSDLFFFNVFPLPLYLLIFPSQVFTSLLGLAVCVVQGYYVVHSDSNAKARLQARNLRQSQRRRKMEMLVTTELMTLSLMAMGGLFILLLSSLTRPFSKDGIQAAMLLLFSTSSLSLTIALEVIMVKFLLRQARDCSAAPGWKWRHLSSLAWPFWPAAVILILSVAALSQPQGWKFWHWGVLLHQLFACIFLRKTLGHASQAWQWLLENPGQMLVTSFLALIFCGAAFLNLPICSSNGKSLGFMDSLFTATSAVCVTGLSVVDISVALSATGKMALALLIQLGGLGIMSLTTFIAMLIGRKLGFFGSAAMRQSVGEEHSTHAKKMLAVIVLGTFVIEAAGTALLFSFYQRSFNWDFTRCLGYAAFMSISSFCNAGFSLHSGNLINFVSEPFLLLLLSALLIIGGLGFGVIVNVFKSIFDRRKIPLGVYERTVLLTGMLLFACGFLLFYFFENDSLLRPLPFSDRLCNAWFSAVSPRTAGFNSLDMTQLQSKSRVLLMLLMFIGGNSASTAGGVKVGTIAIMGIAVHTWLKGQSRVLIGNRRIPQEIIQQATMLIMLTCAIIAGGTLLLTIAMPQARLEDLAFEVISAIGTVGLSTGVTGNLNASGKWLIVILMFMGRVGPVTFLLALNKAKTENIDYPATKFLIG